MTKLFLVRDDAHVLTALEAAGPLLKVRQTHVAPGEPRDELLGIWLKRDLERGLPTWGAGLAEAGLASNGGLSTATLSRGDCELALTDSFSVSGLWALCSIRGRRVRAEDDPLTKRLAVLESWVEPLRTRFVLASHSFFPVFRGHVTRAQASRWADALRQAFPKSVGRTWFVHDEGKGLFPAEPERWAS